MRGFESSLPSYKPVNIAGFFISSLLTGNHFMTRITIVGSLNMDLVVRTPHLPAPGETILGRRFATAPGGKGANQAVAAARLGAPVTMIGRIGADGFGETLAANLKAAGASTERLIIDPDAPTGIALIQVDDGGQNTIVVVAGANGRLTPADIHAAHPAITSAGAVVAQLEVPLAAVEAALRLAHSAQVLTVLNPAPAQTLPDELLAATDILVPNETEASQLTGIPVTDWASAEAAAQVLRRRGPRRVVITLGERGALACSDDSVRRVAPFAVQAVDTTAAGDAFVAALAVACAAGRPFDVVWREASAAGALAATKPGAQPSMPTRAELEDFLRTRPE